MQIRRYNMIRSSMSLVLDPYRFIVNDQDWHYSYKFYQDRSNDDILLKQNTLLIVIWDTNKTNTDLFLAFIILKIVWGQLLIQLLSPEYQFLKLRQTNPTISAPVT